MSGARRGALLALGLVGIVLVAGLLYRAWWPTASDFASTMDRCPLLFCDFDEVYYPMGEAVRSSHAPVSGYYYTPTFALGLSWFGAQPYGVARAAWGALLGVCVLILLVGPLLLFDRPLPLGLAYGALLVTAHPVLHDLAWGQVGAMTTGLVVLAFVGDRRGWIWLAAGALALAIAVKYYAALFGLWFVLRRQWRVVGLCAALSGALLLVVPALAMGWGDTVAFYVEVAQRLRLDGPGNTINSQFAPRVVARWFVALRAGSPAAEGMEAELRDVSSLAVWVVRVGTGALLLAILGAVAGLARRRGAQAALPALVLLSCAVPLVVRTSWPHYFTYLPLCQVAVLGIAARAGRGGAGRLAVGLAVGSAALSSVFFFRFVVGSWQAMGFYGWLLGADLLVLVATLLLVPGLLRADP